MKIPGPCVVCGDINYELSCGGPTICPKCDCGSFDAATVLKQAKVIADLRAENAKLLALVERLTETLQQIAEFDTYWTSAHYDDGKIEVLERSSVGNIRIRGHWSKLALIALTSTGESKGERLTGDAFDMIRLGARAMRRAAEADCGNHSESVQEEAMTSGGLSRNDRMKLAAHADAADEIRKEISGTCEDSALGYASYMGSDEDQAALKALGVTPDWLYRRENGVPSRAELAKHSPAPSSMQNHGPSGQ